MTKLRGGNQQRGLHVVTVQPLEQWRNCLFNKASSVGNKSGETPERGSDLTDHAIDNELTQTFEGHLNVRILLHEARIVATCNKPQVFQINIRRKLTQLQIPARRIRLERRGTVQVSSG